MLGTLAYCLTSFTRRLVMNLETEIHTGTYSWRICIPCIHEPSRCMFSFRSLWNHILDTGWTTGRRNYVP